MTQNEMLLALLEKGGSITQKEAIERFGCYRLPSRINDLKNMGHKIIKVMEYGLNRYGAPTHWARYSLSRENDAQSA